MTLLAAPRTATVLHTAVGVWALGGFCVRSSTGIFGGWDLRAVLKFDQSRLGLFSCLGLRDRGALRARAPHPLPLTSTLKTQDSSLKAYRYSILGTKLLGK